MGGDLAPTVRLSPRAPWWDRALDLLLPPRCIGCGRRGVDVCQTCIEALRPLGSQVCPRCGVPSLDARVCGRCQSRPPLVRAVLAAYPFEGVIRSATLALKYRGRTRLADFLGSALVEPLATRPLQIDVIVPVPLWPDRRRERGFNHSEILAERVSAATGWAVEPGALVRSRDTRRQTELPARSRWTNVAGAFSAPSPEGIAGRRVLLVDDVCTTGATLEACAAPLVGAGANGVWALIVARDLPAAPRVG